MNAPKAWLALAKRDGAAARKRCVTPPTNPHLQEWLAPWLRFERDHPAEAASVEVYAEWLQAFYAAKPPTSWERYGEPKTYKMPRVA